MRKYLYLALAAASAAVMAAPMVAEAAPATASHVLTVRKTHGTAVKPAAALKASLVKGTSAVFSITGFGSLTCKQASFIAIVGKNPTRPGRATEAITSESIGNCKASLMGLKVTKIKALNLPYASTVSDRKGTPVFISGRKSTKPIEMSSTVSFAGHSITCSYKASSIRGSGSNKGNTITIVKQKFTKAAGSNGICPASATFSAKFGPVVDSSLKGNPKVFVN